MKRTLLPLISVSPMLHFMMIVLWCLSMVSYWNHLQPSFITILCILFFVPKLKILNNIQRFKTNLTLRKNNFVSQSVLKNWQCGQVHRSLSRTVHHSLSRSIIPCLRRVSTTSWLPISLCKLQIRRTLIAKDLLTLFIMSCFILYTSNLNCFQNIK